MQNDFYYIMYEFEQISHNMLHMLLPLKIYLTKKTDSDSGELRFHTLNEMQDLTGEAHFKFQVEKPFSGKTLHSQNITYKVVTNKNQRHIIADGERRFGNLFRDNDILGDKKLALRVDTQRVDADYLDNYVLSVIVFNTRSCWGIECMLD